MTQPDTTPAGPRPFGFRVLKQRDWNHVGDLEITDPELWCVSLPHQCDSWDIAGEYGDGVPHQEAVADLRQFIAEAQAALDALLARRETGDPS